MSAHPGSDKPVDDLPLTDLCRIVRARCSGDVVLPQHFCIDIDVDREAEDALVLVVFNAKAADFADMNAVQVHGRACGQAAQRFFEIHPIVLNLRVKDVAWRWRDR
jgi:hypothetical protein